MDNAAFWWLHRLLLEAPSQVFFLTVQQSPTEDADYGEHYTC